MVRVTTKRGVGISGVGVAFEVTGGGGSVSSAEATTDGQGEASVAWVLGTAAGTNNNTATASVPGLSGSPATFIASAGPSGIAAVTITSGNNQRAPVTTRLADSIVVRVTDSYGNRIAGTSVTFSSADYESSISPIGANTDLDGEARVAWTLGSIGGTQALEARTSPSGPTATATATAVRIASLAAREDHTCAISTRGLTFCWGHNDQGQLGDGTTQSRMAPVLVTAGIEFDRIALGNGYSCGLTTDSLAYCWGDNTYGQLGDGTTEDRWVPTAVTGSLRFLALAAGSHTCGLTTDSTAYCWGKNGEGQLGDNSTTDRWVPTAVAGTLKFMTIAVSHGPVTSENGHSCALTAAGAAYCWGRNSASQLGDGSSNDAWQPVAVAGGHSFSEIIAGTFHTCGLISAGTLYCWGSNSNAQFGDGTLIGNPPEPVVGPTNILYGSVSAGAFYTCGLEPPRWASCWGNNGNGQLGSGTTDEQRVPRAVDGGRTYWRISAARYHTCAFDLRGVGYCWGANNLGQLGDGTVTQRLTPVPVNWKLP